MHIMTVNTIGGMPNAPEKTKSVKTNIGKHMNSTGNLHRPQKPVAQVTIATDIAATKSGNTARNGVLS